MSEYPDQQEGGNGQAMGNGSDPSPAPSKDPHVHTLAGDVLQATPEWLRDWQQTDLTYLQKVRELASSNEEAKPDRAVFFYHGGLIYRRWSPKSSQNKDALAWDQLVLPQQCRQLVLNIAHDLPTAVQLGIWRVNCCDYRDKLYSTSSVILSKMA